MQLESRSKNLSKNTLKRDVWYCLIAALGLTPKHALSKPPHLYCPFLVLCFRMRTCLWLFHSWWKQSMASALWLTPKHALSNHQIHFNHFWCCASGWGPIFDSSTAGGLKHGISFGADSKAYIVKSPHPFHLCWCCASGWGLIFDSSTAGGDEAWSHHCCQWSPSTAGYDSFHLHWNLHSAGIRSQEVAQHLEPHGPCNILPPGLLRFGSIRFDSIRLKYIWFNLICLLSWGASGTLWTWQHTSSRCATILYILYFLHYCSLKKTNATLCCPVAQTTWLPVIKCCPYAIEEKRKEQTTLFSVKASIIRGCPGIQ